MLSTFGIQLIYKRYRSFKNSIILFDESLLKNIYPLGWVYINLLGEYNFAVKKVLESDELRPLNINNP